MQSCTWPRYESSFWSPAADHFLWLHVVETKGVWATVDLYTVIRHQRLCAKKASYGKTWNLVHITRKVSVQQGKIQLWEFLVLYISTSHFRFSLAKPKRKAVYFSYLCLTGYIQVRQMIVNKAIDQRQNLWKAGNSRFQTTLYQWKYSKGLLMIRKFKAPSLTTKGNTSRNTTESVWSAYFCRTKALVF